MNFTTARCWLTLSLSCLTPLLCRAGTAPADLPAAVAAVATYKPGQSAEPLARVDELVRSATSPQRKAQLELELMKLLAPGATLEARRFACKQLGIVGTERALPGLAPLLASDETAGFACLALSTYPPGKADAILRGALPRTQGNARIQIINTLGNRRDRKAVKPLAELVSLADPATTEAAIGALGRIADSAAAKVLATLRRQAKPSLSPIVTEASLQLAGRMAETSRRQAARVYEELLATPQPPPVRRAAFAGLLRLDRDGGEQRILATIHSEDARLKPLAIAAVRSVPSRRASETFGRELPKLPPTEQVWMIESLADRNDTAARAAIAQALATSGSPEVRQTAGQALGRIGDASFAPPLATALATANSEAEVNTLVGALASLPGGRATDSAILTEVERAHGKVRAQLIASLASRQSPEVRTQLFRETQHSDPVVVKAAYRVLARGMTAESLPALLDNFVALTNAEQRAELETLVEQAVLNVERPADRSTAVHQQLARDPNREIRVALLNLLPACGDANSRETLVAARVDPDPQVRETAVNALAAWPDDSVWDTLAAIYRKPDSAAQRSTALRGLVRLMSEGKTPSSQQATRYADLLAQAQGDAELKLILGTMGGAKTPEVLNLALPLLDKPGVRAEAGVAVKQIAEAIKDAHPDLAKDALARLPKQQ